MSNSTAGTCGEILDGSLTLSELKLLDAAPEKEFDAIANMASNLFDVPVSLISVIDDDGDRQFFKSQVGLAEPWAKKRETPLTHSFCQHVRNSGEPLVVENAVTHPLVQGNLAIRDLGVVAYLGVPIYSPTNDPIGALCIIDGKKRQWASKDVAHLTDLARCVTTEIKLRATAWEAEALYADLFQKHQDTERYNALREWLYAAFMAPGLSSQERFEALLKHGCDALNMDRAVITKVEFDRVGILFGHNLPDLGIVNDYALGNSLSARLIGGRDQFHFHDAAATTKGEWLDILGNSPASFAGVPLIVDGEMFGTLELSSQSPRATRWSDEEISMLSVISMLCCVYLGFTSKISALKRSEVALLNHLLEGQNREFEVHA